MAISGDDAVATNFLDQRAGGWGIDIVCMAGRAVPVQGVITNSLDAGNDELFVLGGDWSSMGLNGSHHDSHDGQDGSICEQHV